MCDAIVARPDIKVGDMFFVKSGRVAEVHMGLQTRYIPISATWRERPVGIWEEEHKWAYRSSWTPLWIRKCV